MAKKASLKLAKLATYYWHGGSQAMAKKASFEAGQVGDLLLPQWSQAMADKASLKLDKLATYYYYCLNRSRVSEPPFGWMPWSML
jgi:hypothetical protein